MKNLRVFGLGLFLMVTGTHAFASPRVPVPFQDAGQDGYTLLIWQDASPDEINLILDRITKSGSKHLMIPYFGCQTDLHSSDVGSCQVVFRVGASALARLAIAKGFSVSFLPIVVTLDWQWRGFFDPTDVEGWFRTYTAWIKRVAREAQDLGMKELVVSSETTKLYRYEAQWRHTLTEVRTVFGGPLILTVNWGDLNHGFWDAADAIGISAYYPLSQNKDPSQQELDAAWQNLRNEMVARSKKWNRPIHLTEIGYPSVTSAAKTPWAYASGNPSDFALQARCFEAFRKAWTGVSSLVRASIWATEAQNPASSGFPFGFETLGKPAEDVLRRFFVSRTVTGGI